MVTGNGGVALSLAPLGAQPELAHDGILFVDHPGYGLNDGHPSATGMQQGLDTAIAALAAQVNIPPETLLSRAGIVGHSLGTGIASEFAVAHPEVHRVVLLAPFTSLRDMAYNAVGPVASLLHHNYDNDANLKVLGARSPPPAVEIVHGTTDRTIPVAMSRRMAKEYPWLREREIAGNGHDFTSTESLHVIAADMAAMP